ncbi:unnamed protein product [Closterium sp. NIES-54]
MVTTTTPGGQRVSICTCTRMGRHLATFTRRQGPSLYTLATEPPQVVASAQVSASGQVAPPCSCRLLSHQTLLWHHRLGQPSVPRLRGMHSRLLVSGLRRSLPPLPHSRAPPCLPCVEGRQRAAPHSSSFPPTTAPLQTLQMDVWGPAHVTGQGRERYFLLVVDDYTRYTTVFPLRSKGEVPDDLIPWICAVCLQLHERFGQDHPVLRLHSDRGGEFSSNLLRDFCRGEGITHSFTLSASPQQNGIAERRIDLVKEVARTSVIHAAAPHFLWPSAVGDASVFRVWGSRAFVRDTSADKLSARAIPCVFLGFPPDAPGWQFYHPTSCHVLFSQDVTFDESVPFYRLFPYRSAPPPPSPLFLAPSPPLVDPLPAQGSAPSGVSQVDPLRGTVPVEVGGDSGAARGAASGGVGPRGAEPGGAKSYVTGSGGAEPGGAEPEGAEPTGVEPRGVEPEGAESEGAESGGAKPRGVASSGGPAGASPRLSPRPEPLSPQQLRHWLVWRARLQSGAAGAGASAAGDTGVGGVGATRLGGAGVTAGAGGTRGTVAVGSGGARTRGTGAVGTGSVGGTRASGAGAGDPAEPRGAGVGGTRSRGTGAGCAGAVGAGARGTGAGGAGAGAVDPVAAGAGAGGGMSGGIGARGTLRPRPYFIPLLQQVLGLLSSTRLTPLLLCIPPDKSQPPLPPASPLPAPSPYIEQTGGLTERREPASRPVFPVWTVCRIPHLRPPPVPGTHAMTLRPSSVPLSVPLPPPRASSLPAVPDPPSDLARAASPTVSRLLATVITDPSFESTAASALVAELLDFAATCRLDYDTALVAESESASPPSVGGECALGTDVLEDRSEDFECLADAVPRFASMLLAPEGDPDAPNIPTPRSYAEEIKGTYVDAVPPSGAKIIDGMWIFRVKRLPGSPPAFKARYVARGLSQRQGVDYFQTFSPTPKITTLQMLLHVAAQRDYELHSLNFSTAFLQFYGLRQAPREWHDTLRTTLAALGFTPSTADPSLFLRTDTSLLPFYVLVYVDDLVFATADTKALTLFSSPQPTPLSTGHSLSAPPSDESVEPSGPYPELVGCLMYLMTCTRPDLMYPFSLLARYVAPGMHRKMHWDAAKRVLRYLCSTSGMGLVLRGRSPVVLTCHADASWVDNLATQRSSQGYTFSLGSGSVSWRSTRSSLILSSICEAEIYARAMAEQELRWLSYLLTDLGEQPRSPPVLRYHPETGNPTSAARRPLYALTSPRHGVRLPALRNVFSPLPPRVPRSLQPLFCRATTHVTRAPRVRHRDGRGVPHKSCHWQRSRGRSASDSGVRSERRSGMAGSVRLQRLCVTTHRQLLAQSVFIPTPGPPVALQLRVRAWQRGRTGGGGWGEGAGQGGGEQVCGRRQAGSSRCGRGAWHGVSGAAGPVVWLPGAHGSEQRCRTLRAGRRAVRAVGGGAGAEQVGEGVNDEEGRVGDVAGQRLVLGASGAVEKEEGKGKEGTWAGSSNRILFCSQCGSPTNNIVPPGECLAVNLPVIIIIIIVVVVVVVVINPPPSPPPPG